MIHLFRVNPIISYCNFSRLFSSSSRSAFLNDHPTNGMEDLIDHLQNRKKGTGLPGFFFTDPSIFQAELKHLFYREWLFAGHDCEIPQPGQWMTLQIGCHPIVIVRDHDQVIRAFHNICRHRGYKLCEGHHGRVKLKRLVCPYHQWTFDLNGNLAFARDMQPSAANPTQPPFDPAQYGLKPVRLEAVQGYLFISLANPLEEAPDFQPIRSMLAPYLAPFKLQEAKVAYESRIIEKANWKIVWENNRECYHCRGCHPELSKTFPEAPTHAYTGPEGPGSEPLDPEIALIERCEAQGLPSRFKIAPNHQYRVMRLNLLPGQRSMTMDGQPAVREKRLGIMPKDENVGDVLYFNFPTTWNHFTPDHALSFRVNPLSPTETELITKWIVPADAIEGRDYDLKTLTEVWLATNQQDKDIVERVQQGVTSPAFEPGPPNHLHEDGVIQFIEWYSQTMKSRLIS